MRSSEDYPSRLSKAGTAWATLCTYMCRSRPTHPGRMVGNSETIPAPRGFSSEIRRSLRRAAGFGLLLTGALLAAETCEQRLFVIFGVWLGRLDPNLLQ